MRIEVLSSGLRVRRRELHWRAFPLGELLLLVLTALILQGACVPHTHSSPGIGLYNEEHDLTLYAASGTVGALPVTPPLLVLSTVQSALVLPVPMGPAGYLVRDAESRAPPAA